MKTARHRIRQLVPFALLLMTVATFPAAAQTVDEAMTAYERGDYATALRGFQMHAERGDARAQYNLGRMYEYGRGVVQDFVQAHKWYNLAVSRFFASQRDLREKSVRNRDRVAAQMIPADLAEAQRLAREWRPSRLLEFDFSTLPNSISPD